jgi:hypothetical protein
VHQNTLAVSLPLKLPRVSMESARAASHLGRVMYLMLQLKEKTFSTRVVLKDWRHSPWQGRAASVPD